MRGIFLFLLVVAALAQGDETTVRPQRFHPRCCDVVGTTFVTPRQLEYQLSWNAEFLKYCFGLDDPAKFAAELKALLETSYHNKGFWEVSVTVTAKPDDRFRVEITEGARFKRGAIEFVGAKQIDTKRLALWMGQTIPKMPQPIVLAVDESNQPSLQRLPNGQLRRESPIDAASGLADPGQLATELQKLPFDTNATAAPSASEAAASKIDLIAAGKLDPSFVEKVAEQRPELAKNRVPATQVLPVGDVPAAVPSLDKRLPDQPLWLVNGFAPKHEHNVPFLEKWLPQGLNEQGFSHTRFRVEMIPQSSTATVLLKVVILEEGPATHVQEIEITGLRNNTREAILKRLDLKVGQRIDAARAQSLEEKLADSGRFLRHHVSIGPADEAGNATVSVDLRELPKGPTLADELSDDQQLLLRAANGFNRWSESPDDLVIDVHPGKDAPRDGSWTRLDWTAVTSGERLLIKLRSVSPDGTHCESWLMAGDGWLEFASSSLRQRGRLKFTPSIETSLTIAGEPDNPAGHTTGLNVAWHYRSSAEGAHRFRLRHGQSDWLAKTIDEVKSLDGALAEFNFVPKARQSNPETLVIDRRAGRICSYSRESNAQIVQLEVRRGALADALAEARLKAADFEDVTSKPFPEAQFVKLVLQALDGAGLRCPGLSREQQALAASVLKRLDVEHAGKALTANSPPATSESLVDSGGWPLAMQVVSMGTQTTQPGDVANSLRPWMALTQFLGGMTLSEPVARDSVLAEQLRFDAVRLVGLSNQSAVDALTSRDDFGPLAGLLGATNMLSKLRDPNRQFAAIGIERLDQFARERDALLTPGTASHTLAILLVEHLRQSPLADRELIATAFDLSDSQKLQLATSWRLLDQAKSMPTAELLPALVDAAWTAGLKEVVSAELERVLLGDIVSHMRVVVLINQSTHSMGRKRPREALMWLDRAEASLLEYLDSIPARRRNAAVEEVRLKWLGGVAMHRVGAHLACRDFDAAFEAAKTELDCSQRRLAALDDGPVVDDFAGTLTKRGQLLGSVISVCERIASVEWHRSGRDAALKWITQAEALAREFEAKDVPEATKQLVARPLSSRSLFWSYADKDGRRDPAQAMALAKRAYEWGGDDSGRALDAMACAYAASGDFDEAVKWARRADLLVSDVAQKPIAQARLRRFLAGKLPADEMVELQTVATPKEKSMN